ncbi:hypothetical protein ACWDBW_16145 [Streptomyces sp. NPDC001107]
MLKKIILPFVAAIALVAGLAAPAQAADFKWHSHPYEVYFSATSPLGVCLLVDAHGSIRFYSRTVTGGYDEIQVHEVQLDKPTMYVQSRNNCGRNGHAVKLSKITQSQVWYNYSCSNNWQLSAGTGWFGGVGYTRTCGNKQRAGRTTTDENTSLSIQHNTGYHATLSHHFLIDEQTGKICERLDLSTTIHLHGDNDYFIQTLRPCVLGH